MVSLLSGPYNVPIVCFSECAVGKSVFVFIQTILCDDIHVYCRYVRDTTNYYPFFID